MQRASPGARGGCRSIPMIEAGNIAEQADINTGDEADYDFIRSAVGFILRVLTHWLLLLLLGLASLVGC